MEMRRRAIAFVEVVSVAAIAATAAHAAGVHQSTARGRRTAEAVRAVAQLRARESARAEADLRFYQARVARDPFGAADRAKLAGLYAQRARETGEYEDYLRAEREARASVAARPERNAAGRVALAGALMSQHRFAEARAQADTLVAAEPDRPSYRSLLGELQMETGDYDGARATFGSLLSSSTSLGVAPRLARWMELTGQTPRARILLHRAAHDAEARGDLPREQVAWFHLRVGDLELRNGRLDQAQEAFMAGLRAYPEDYRLLGEMAKVAAARGEWNAALELGGRAIAQVLDPATLAVMSDAALASGDSAKAEEYARAMEVSVRRQTGSLHRGWALFLLDHGRRVDQVAAQAAADLVTRRDVYGYDLLAWAQHKQGNDAAARRTMARALGLGTRDAQLFYHAGMIAYGLHDTAGAKRYLRDALKVNPSFHPVQANEARATLRALD